MKKRKIYHKIYISYEIITNYYSLRKLGQVKAKSKRLLNRNKLKTKKIFDNGLVVSSVNY